MTETPCTMMGGPLEGEVYVVVDGVRVFVADTTIHEVVYFAGYRRESGDTFRFMCLANHPMSAMFGLGITP